MKKGIVVSLVLIGAVLCGFLYYTLSPLLVSLHIDEESPSALKMEERSDIGFLKSPLVGTQGHNATGTVQIIGTDTGRVLRYENFKTTNGPDLFVYLSTDLEATEFVSLGELKATEGSINYEIPESVDLDKYPYVLIWCKKFGVLFNSAEIKRITVDEETKSAEILKAKETKNTMPEITTTKTTAYFANGCFWCVEHDLEKVPGVIGVVSGYSGGTTLNPTYENYHKGGHREVVEVTYDPSLVSFGNLVEHIIKHGDPTDAEGSFFDRGVYYAPAIYFKNTEEKLIAEAIIKAVDEMKVFASPLPLVVIKAETFWPAEDYHQDYSKKNPIRYNYYRAGSGRTKFIDGVWGGEVDTFTISQNLNTTKTMEDKNIDYNSNSWSSFVKPSEADLKTKLSPIAYSVTQEEGTERSGTHPYDKNYDEGIYVDIVSGEPLFLSRDKYDSKTGWPSFTKPISEDVITTHIDKKLFSSRTEVRSRYADSHLGHVFTDGPSKQGGMRYCMNGAALRFIAKSDMDNEGYGYLLSAI